MGPLNTPLSYDWHGINRNGDRLITFAKRPLSDGGGYVLDVPERDAYGYLFAAAPALLAACESALCWLDDEEGNSARQERIKLGNAIDLAKGPKR